MRIFNARHGIDRGVLNITGNVKPKKARIEPHCVYVFTGKISAYALHKNAFAYAGKTADLLFINLTNMLQV